jgi:hypothetical protein
MRFAEKYGMPVDAAGCWHAAAGNLLRRGVIEK